MVFVFNGDLAGDILATKLFVFGEPGGGVAVGFLGVGGGVHGEEVEGVSGELVAFVGGKILSTFLPSVGEGDDVVDLDAGGNLGTFGKDEMLAGVRFIKFAGDDVAAV